MLFGASELLAVLFTFSASRRSRFDQSKVSRMVPLMYCLPLLLSATPSRLPHVEPWLIFLMFGQVILRTYMWSAVTVGIPNYTVLKANGPYRFLRHPLAATEMGIVILFALRFASVWNVMIAIIAVLCFRWAAVREETFLLGFPEYRAYAGRVRWRFLPLG
jgi:protein-S-isoprenylcysteine O-methyltransferase Ste14